MEEFFVREWARTSGRGLFWLRTVGDACRVALRLRLTGSPPGQPPREQTGMFSALLQDVRHGLRTVRRAPAFHFGAVAILAIGIGATAAAFSIVDGVLIRPLPYPGAERLLQVGSTFRMNPERLGPLSEPDAIAIQRNTTTLEAFAAVGGGSRILLGTGDPEELSVASVTEGYLDMLGARPALGRLLLPDDHAPGAPRVVVLEHGFWVDRFGGDIDLVGQTLELDNDVYEIIGVLHADFVPPGRLPGAGYPIWTQMGLSSREPVEGRFFLSALGRMRPGMSPTDVEAEITRVIEERYADGTGANFVVGGTAAPLRERLLQGSGRPIMLAQAGVGLLLLITCVNVASLLLARASDRRNELAVRSALGAHPRRVMAQLLVESVTLSAIAGVVGAGVAFLGVEAFKAVSPGTLSRLQEVSVDGRILGFTLVISAVTGIAFGLLPALQASTCPTCFEKVGAVERAAAHAPAFAQRSSSARSRLPSSLPWRPASWPTVTCVSLESILGSRPTAS